LADLVGFPLHDDWQRFSPYEGGRKSKESECEQHHCYLQRDKKVGRSLPQTDLLT